MKAYLLIWFGLLGLCLLPLKARAQQPTLVGAEYFFNADPGFGNGANIPITSGPDVSFQTQVSTTGLGLGFHRLSVRFLDNIGNWGQVSTRTLWLGRVTALTAVPIVAAEYFFNADPGFGNGTAVAVSSGLTVDFTTVVSTAGLSEGFHRLSFRVRDQNDIWSLIQTRIFWIGRTNPDQISPIVAAEYFINTDPGFGNGTALAVTQGPNPQVEGVINVGDLPRGFHRLSVRFRNQANEWGLVTTKLFFVENEGFTDPALVDFIEYFFDDDDPGLGQAIEIPLDEAASNIDLDELIEVAALEEGEHTISLRIKNNKGLWSIVETREFTVGEPTPGDPPIPDLETLPDLNAECLVDFSALDVPTATAADGSSLTGTTDESIFPISQQGTTTITWTYTDENGLETTQTQNIVIQDITPPTISLPAEIIVEANPGQCFATGVNLGTPITDDNCGVGSVVNNAPSSFAVGLNEVLWTVTDVGGNTAQFLQLVTVQDTQLPVIPEIADLIVNTDEDACSATGVNLTTPSASDNCGISSLTNDAPEVFPLGPTLVTWTAVDPSGNSSTRSFNVIVNDTQNPIIIAPANVTVLIGEDEDVATNVELGTPETSDNCSIASVTNDAASEFPLGQNTVIWTIIDGSGNSATAEQIVNITREVLPTITAPADITVDNDEGTCQATGIDLGTPEVTGEDIPENGISNNAPESFPVGTTVVTWTVIDGNGNQSTAFQNVTVVDNEAPSITAPANINIQLGPEEEFAADVELGQPTVSDNCSIASVTNDAPNSFALGINTVIWTVIDESGNMATAEQLVVVKKEEACVVTAKAKATITLKINSLGEAKLTTAMVDDGSFATCGPLRLDLSKFDFSCDDLGENMVKLIATDAEDNIDEAEFKVIVLDEERPKIKIKKAAFVWMMRAGDTFTMPDFRGRVEASDNCGFELIQHPAPGTQYRKPVNFFVEFEAKDLSGNISKERFRFILLVSKNKGPVRKNNKEIEFVDSGLWSVPWNTPFNWLVKEEISFEEGSDPEAIRQIKWNPLGYDPLIPGFYQIEATLLNESFNGFDAEMSLPVIVESKPLPEDILISRNLVPDKVHSGETIGSLKTIDPVDNVHIYTIDDHPNFHIDKDVLIWKGNGQPDAVMKVNVHSTDRAGQTISRELTLYREVDPNSILVYPNPAKQETNILVQLSGESDVTIRVFDAAGRSVYEEHSHQSETFVRNLDLRELSSGMYHIVVQIDKRVLTGRLVKGL